MSRMLFCLFAICCFLAEAEWVVPHRGEAHVFSLYGGVAIGSASPDSNESYLVDSLRNLKLLDAQGKWCGKNTSIVLNGNFLATEDAFKVLKRVAVLRSQGAQIRIALSKNDLMKLVYYTPVKPTQRKAFFTLLRDTSSLFVKVGKNFILPDTNRVPRETSAGLVPWANEVQNDLDRLWTELAQGREVSIPESINEVIGRSGEEKDFLSAWDIATLSVRDRPMIVQLEKELGVQRSVVAVFGPTENLGAFAKHVINATPTKNAEIKLKIENQQSEPKLGPGDKTTLQSHVPGKDTIYPDITGVQLGHRHFRSGIPHYDGGVIQHETPQDPESESFKHRDRKNRLCGAAYAGLITTGALVGSAGIAGGVYIATLPPDHTLPANWSSFSPEEKCSFKGGSVDSWQGEVWSNVCVCPDQSLIDSDQEWCDGR